MFKATFLALAVLAVVARVSALPAKGIDIKSVRCNTFPKDKSPVPAVIQCIEKLAADNSTNCEAATLKSFCQSGNTFILGWRKVDKVSLAAPSCKSVARSLGRIMDFCTHDGMVMGEATAWDDPATGVMIRNFTGGVMDKNMTLLH
ncbi:hypothetical protein CPLU01_02821 [Colletotrichum plurivorum]|uniref:Uncharacterized protein n=1 Tax=Colletotrichum plurivorum TaxID=2175906 RepID=A0A8H6NMD3_9PEZI|nr:hypothetical protein CPLU01_02821 [Colletotrichum plurivorum]